MPIRVACVLSAHEVGAHPVDLIVFPEGIDELEIRAAQRHHPRAIIIGATTQHGCSRALMLVGDMNRIDYWKIGTDGRTRGTDNLNQIPVRVIGDTCIGVLVCMDVQHPTFARSVVDAVRASSATTKLLCIPADMGDFWFAGDQLLPSNRFEGIHVIVCNHTKSHPQSRCKSFVADTQGNKIRVQREVEPIYAEL